MNKPVTRSVWKLAAFTVVMFGFGFGLVPLYDVICDVTGLNGKTGRVTEAQAAIQDAGVRDRGQAERSVTVEFVAGMNRSMNWEVAPQTQTLEVKPGKVYEVNYLAKNAGAFRTVGQAVPSVAPNSAARFFNKTECFCFTKQALGPGEERLMPLRFVVNPKLPEHVRTISLAYTFFDVTDKPEPSGA